MALDNPRSRNVTQQHYERLQRWSERKPCVALMGEFSAGKSTLLNFLIESELLPTQITATELPPIWFTHGTEQSFWVDQDWNQHDIEPKDLNAVPINARFARIYVEAEFLRHCDVIDTPGISDPNLAADSWRIAAGFANMVLWCTTATQAWRETERSTWLALPARLRRHSLLLVTRADKLLTEADREKVARRLRREAGELFAETVFVATHNAVKAKREMAEGTPTPLWAQSGAATLMDEIFAQFDAISEHRRKMFSRYAVGDPRTRVLRLEAPLSSDGSESGVGETPAVSVTPVRPVRISRPGADRRTERPVASPGQDRREWLREAFSEARREEEAELDETVDEARELDEAAEIEVTPEPIAIETAPETLDDDAGASMPAVMDHGQADEDELPEEDVVLEASPEAVRAPEATEEEPRSEAPLRSVSLRIPKEVAIWRDIVSKAPQDMSAEQVIALIDELLCRLYGEKEDQGQSADQASDDLKSLRHRRSEAAASSTFGNRAEGKGWRRLA
ncbi:dynamin family protein [Ostreiculturibacter nitratireducens]|uniref:dynamin family protein n=1 Tax=Ostreiculturibacter nitratireducens TaxID=3075226 RepID=UPI0031B5B37B